MRKVQTLAELQRVDSALDRARERLAAVKAQLGDRSALAAIEAEHEAAQRELQRKTGEQRDLELEIDDLRQKLTTLEKKLYGGSVQNPKELNDMANEAKQYRGLISTREDRLLELYDLMERLSSTAEEVAGRLSAALSSHQQRQAELRAEQESLLKTIAEQEQQRAALAGEADPQALRVYDSLRRKPGNLGLAVAEVAQRTCQGCRVTLPASEEIRARSSEELVFCESCRRILHAGL